MMTEAIRAYLVSLDVQAQDWTKEQLLAHVDEVLLASTELDCLAMVADELFHNLMVNLITVKETLKRDA